MTQNNGQFTPGFGTEKCGSDFFPDAKPNPDRLVADLTNGVSVSVFGYKRIGKSSLLAETRDRLESMGKNVILIRMESRETVSMVLALILNSIQQGNRSGIFAGLRTWLDNSEAVPTIFKTKTGALVSAVFDRTFQNHAEEYINVLSNQTIRLLQAYDPDTKLIIILDELTTFIKNSIVDATEEDMPAAVGRLNSFLGLLRGLRKSDVGVTMVVSGSVSIDWLELEYGIRSDSINDCVRRNVEELDRQAAKNLLEMCVAAEKHPNWTEQFTEDLLDFLPSFYPGVVQSAFWTISKKSTPVGGLDNSLREKIDEELWDYFLRQINDHFQQFNTGEKRRIMRLFDALAKEQSGEINGGEALEILDSEDCADGEMNGGAIISSLLANSFLGVTVNGFKFYSGLVPAWYRMRSKEKNWANSTEFCSACNAGTL